mmetsp:Transcript_77042/g.222835  ORF Transcript_77042/g.222835 Transcript_77042/m.222835 type:complete len:117 (-) Transcript_77042:796-1146(-)
MCIGFFHFTLFNLSNIIVRHLIQTSWQKAAHKDGFVNGITLLDLTTVLFRLIGQERLSILNILHDFIQMSQLGIFHRSIVWCHNDGCNKLKQLSGRHDIELANLVKKVIDIRGILA